MQRRPLIAGNWKMNGSAKANANLIKEILAGMSSETDVEWLVCPPAIFLESVGRAINGTELQLGAQNLCEQGNAGAFTGEIQGAMLTEVGCRYVIVGHSERRALYAEDDARVAQKFAAAQAAGLIPVLCVGETLEERERDATRAVLSRQLGAVLEIFGADSFKNAVVAYEPIWAIGTGRTASPDQAQAVHAFLRGEIAKRNAIIADSLRILYGGSVKPDNAQELFAGVDVDGGLIGGASLKAADFLAIGRAARL